MSGTKGTTVAVVETDAQRIVRLEAENIALRERMAARNTIGMKVSAKGALSVYGLGRFPVTLYASQWERLLKDADTILAFIKANGAALARKENA